MKLKDKVEIYNRLLAILSKGVRLAALLQERGDSALPQVEASNEQLAQAAAGIRNSIHAQWQGQAAATLRALKTARDGVQGEVASIEKTIEIAAKVVKAIGYIDDAAAIAAKLLA